MSDPPISALEASLCRRIAASGPVSIAEFMAEALTHPRFGYYRRATAIGSAGDFVTAPEISQIFGELIGAWLAERWLALGRPAGMQLIELGPGRGSLMADALRATRGVPGFHDSLCLNLVELNATLRTAQRQALAGFARHLAIAWHEQLEQVPAGPTLLVANEFFDALPIRQLQWTNEGWRERMVGLDPASGRLVMALAPGPSPFALLLPAALRQARPAPGTVTEIAPQRSLLAQAIASRIAAQGGAALIIDYGSTASPTGATLQAVRAHVRVDILDRPGESDLSAHVDFAALAEAVRGGGAQAWGPVSQRLLLQRLGIETRAQALAARADPAQRAAIAASVHRLTAAEAMGDLFQALAISPTATDIPPGFSA